MSAERWAGGARIALIGSVGLMAKELRSALERRTFPASDVRLFDDRGDGVLSEYDGEALVVARPEIDALEGTDIGFLCGSAEEMAPYFDWPARAGFTAIDLSGGAASRAGVPLVHTEINPQDIQGSLVAAPQAIAHNLSTVAAIARQVAPLSGLEAVALVPVSAMGEPAIDELYQQTVGLLSFSEVPTAVLERQVAFNVAPVKAFAVGGLPGSEERARAECERLLGMAEGSIIVRAALAPVFHGHTMHVTLRFDRAPDLEVLSAAFEAARGTRLVLDPADFSPVGLAGEEQVAVAGLEVHPLHPESLSCWIFCDNLKGGATLNAVRIAERLVDRVGEATR